MADYGIEGFACWAQSEDIGHDKAGERWWWRRRRRRRRREATWFEVDVSQPHNIWRCDHRNRLIMPDVPILGNLDVSHKM